MVELRDASLDAAERYSVYKDPLVAQFLAGLFEGGGEVRPRFDLAYGYRYPEVEEALGRDPVWVRDFLKRLSDLGVLDRELFDMSIRCPSCNSANVSTNYVCPICSSMRIERNMLIEHIACGYIDNVTMFRVDSELVCPRCKAALGKDDYRSAGSWYRCLDCGERIENPMVIHKCRDCGDKFTFDDAKYIEVYSYRLSDAAVMDIRNGALFSPLAKKFFSDLGFDVEVPGRLAGESGIQHRFDILLRLDGDRIIAIDTLFSHEPVDQEGIVKEYGKIFDTKVEAYIVVNPSLNEEARKLAKTYGLNVIEGNPYGSLDKLKEILTQKKAAEKTVKTIKEETVSISKEEKPSRFSFLKRIFSH